jgi:hypothetical protein
MVPRCPDVAFFVRQRRTTTTTTTDGQTNHLTPARMRDNDDRRTNQSLNPCAHALRGNSKLATAWTNLCTKLQTWKEISGAKFSHDFISIDKYVHGAFYIIHTVLREATEITDGVPYMRA